jgi:hypothetical protein
MISVIIIVALAVSHLRQAAWDSMHPSTASAWSATRSWMTSTRTAARLIYLRPHAAAANQSKEARVLHASARRKVIIAFFSFFNLL